MNYFSKNKFKFLVFILGISFIGFFGGCGQLTPDPNKVIKEIKSSAVRISNPSIPTNDLSDFVKGNNQFAFDLYRTLMAENQGENIFYSPYSISLALSMMYAGSANQTKTQMAQTLHFGPTDSIIYGGFNYLDTQFTQQKLNIANSIWVQNEYPFLDSFLTTLSENYDCAFFLTNFIKNPEGSMTAMNDWVNQKTNGTIKQLFSENDITSFTRLVLINTIYFNADWKHVFPKDNTKLSPFTLFNNVQKNVDMMSLGKSEDFLYVKHDTYQVLSIPYEGDKVNMLIILPDSGKFSEVESHFNQDVLSSILNQLETQAVTLSFPKFTFEYNTDMVHCLKQLGMVDAFAGESADFSALDGSKNLYISKVVHKAFIKVDEKGTEASAATGVIGGITSAPPFPVIEFCVNRPFIFIIEDQKTQSILFMGRVLTL